MNISRMLPLDEFPISQLETGSVRKECEQEFTRMAHAIGGEQCSAESQAFLLENVFPSLFEDLITREGAVHRRGKNYSLTALGRAKLERKCIRRISALYPIPEQINALCDKCMQSVTFTPALCYAFVRRIKKFFFLP